MTFGQKLRELREAKELSRAALGELSGVPFGTIHGYELDRRAPTLSATMKLAKALGVSCEAFSECEDVKGETEEKAAKKPATRKGKK
jgi:transcriptional regulator with XRE-family HTH domain